MIQHNTFTTITNPYLKAFNRMMIAYNLSKDERAADALSYLGQFNDKDKFAIAVVTADVKKRGFTEVKKSIQEELNRTEELIDDLQEGTRDIKPTVAYEGVA